MSISRRKILTERIRNLDRKGKFKCHICWRRSQDLNFVSSKNERRTCRKYWLCSLRMQTCDVPIAVTAAIVLISLGMSFIRMRADQGDVAFWFILIDY